MKKAGVRQPAAHVSVDDGSDESADDDIEQSVEQPSIIAASLVVGSLIVVPLSVALLVTFCARLYRQGSTLLTVAVCVFIMFSYANDSNVDSQKMSASNYW